MLVVRQASVRHQRRVCSTKAYAQRVHAFMRHSLDRCNSSSPTIQETYNRLGSTRTQHMKEMLSQPKFKGEILLSKFLRMDEDLSILGSETFRSERSTMPHTSEQSDDDVISISTLILIGIAIIACSILIAVIIVCSQDARDGQIALDDNEELPVDDTKLLPDKAAPPPPYGRAGCRDWQSNLWRKNT